ncbi:hypothetical protein JL720_15396 [Aureococcus anophagefferens]|nr:hypothetical protein JL720_15396 [Aureococcus anophagefferens]
MTADADEEHEPRGEQQGERALHVAVVVVGRRGGEGRRAARREQVFCLDATVVHAADARVDDDDAPPPPPTGASSSRPSTRRVASDGDSSAPASPAAAAVFAAGARDAAAAAPGRAPEPAPDDDDDDDDDDLISIEDAYMGGYLDARQYQARLARVDEDPMAAFFKAPRPYADCACCYLQTLLTTTKVVPVSARTKRVWTVSASTRSRNMSDSSSSAPGLISILIAPRGDAAAELRLLVLADDLGPVAADGERRLGRRVHERALLLQRAVGDELLVVLPYAAFPTMAGDEGNRKLECLAAIATGIIVFSLGFEFGKERLYDNTSETMKPIITALFSELTTLGFIGLMLFVVFQLEWIGDLSENLFEDEEALDGLSETAHMVLFLVMVLFLAQVVGLVVLGENIQAQWHTWELVCCHGADSIPKVAPPRNRPRCRALHRFSGRLTQNHRLALFAATRKTFMVNHPEEITDASCFQFSTYLSTALDDDRGIHCEAHLDDDDPRSPGGVPLEESKDADLEAPLLDGAAEGALTTEEKPRRRRLASLARVTADHLGLGTTLDACYEKNFWFGQSTKAKFTLDVMRLATFCQSIYLAIFLVVYGKQLLGPRGHPNSAQASLCFRSWPVVAALFAVALFPPLTTTAKMTRIIEDFTVVAHIDTFVNRRFIQQVLRRQKTVAAFAALRVVQSFYDTDRLRATTGAERTTSKADDAAAAGGRCWPCGGGAHSQTEALGLDVARLKRRRHWRTLFKIFDSDGQGSIDLDEIRDLLSKFAHACNSEASSHGEAEHDLINKRIFDLIDEDHSGCISIDELHEVFVRLGQHVSMDGPNIVSDIDEDGDGTLDAEEFSILLNRLHI